MTDTIPNSAPMPTFRPNTKLPNGYTATEDLLHQWPSQATYDNYVSLVTVARLDGVFDVAAYDGCMAWAAWRMHVHHRHLADPTRIR